MQNEFDVIIVGGGLSGIGAAYHLQKHCPGKSYAILEGRAAMGGTWDLFRYPGIRSDSDMHTLGYNFKPWIHEKAIAEGPAILDYIRETAEENRIEENIRYDHKVSEANWDSHSGCWTVTASTGDGQVTLQTQYLLMCAGYYSYTDPYAPDFEGRERFQGEILHPQFWPEDYDYSGKRVVIIGSGATAMTMVPAMTDKAAHVTMLQRSPTYVVSRPWRDWIANSLRKVLPDSWAYAITRWKNIRWQQVVYKRTRTHPQQMKDLLLNRLRKKLNADIDIDKHFSPNYNPWDQRLCLIPDDDLHIALNSGKASVVTDQVDTFTETGILLNSGQEIAADIIITATGLQMVQMGEVALQVDGEAVRLNETWTYKGLMLTGVPNLVNTFGYINASWTLGADLTAEYFCQLVNHVDSVGATQVTPRLREGDENMTPRDFIDDFSSGYMQRVMPLFPRQGDREPWLNTQDYVRDKKLLRNARFDDGALVFSSVTTQNSEVTEPLQMQAAG